mmetsp:Transcript_56231/g.121149  ORF Transcript_56231/g.121149 Transcript_56231/m.121149 type:complete len:349 (-) Transcript_56231:491-1537(-)
MAHGAHDLRGIVRSSASDVDVAYLQPCSALGMLRPDDQHANELAVLSAALSHVFHDIVVVVLGGLVIDLQDLVDPDDGAGGTDLDGRQCQHGALPGHGHALHANGHTADHAHGADRIVGPLDGHGNPQDQHAIKLERPLCLLDGRDLAEAVIGAFVASEPDVQDGVLVGIVAHTPVSHCLVELLREGVLRDAQVVWQIAQVETPILARRIDVVGGSARVRPRHPLEAVPEHALTSRRAHSGSACLGLPVLVHVLLLLLAAALLALAAPLRRVRRGAALLLLLLLLLALFAVAVAVAAAIPILPSLTVAVAVAIAIAATLAISVPVGRPIGAEQGAVTRCILAPRRLPR